MFLFYQFNKRKIYKYEKIADERQTALNATFKYQSVIL